MVSLEGTRPNLVLLWPSGFGFGGAIQFYFTTRIPDTYVVYIHKLIITMIFCLFVDKMSQ